jgi:hypothetical protein
VSIPNQLTAGDSLRLSIASRGRTVADGWALTLLLIPAAGSGPRLSASTAAADPENPAAHLLTVAASATAAWAPVSYTWVLQATRGAERETIASGSTAVLPDPAAAGATAAMDLRSTARQALAAIDAYLRDPKNLKASGYTLNGRTLNRYPRAELLAERSKWQAEVAREEAAERLAAGLADRRRIYVRFGA